MAYNKAIFKQIREEYEGKYLTAEQAADRRRFEIYSKIPAVAEIDRQLRSTAFEVLSAAASGKLGEDGRDVAEAVMQIKANNASLSLRRAALLVDAGYPANYTDVLYECKKCGDTGYVGTEMCDCMRHALIMAGYEASGIATLLRTQTFSTFSLDYYKNDAKCFDNMKYVRNVMQRFAFDFSQDKMQNLVLFGGTGLGKTHLSSAVAGVVIERGFDVLYTTAVGMLSEFEYRRFGSGIGTEESGDYLSRLYDCDLLIIDDLGSEVVNQFTVSCIYNVINIRLNKRKSTIISTNLTQTDLRKRYWDRITSRIFGEYSILLFTGTDVRAQKLR